MIIDTHVHFGGVGRRYKAHSVDDLLAVAFAAGTDRIVQVTVGFENALADEPTPLLGRENQISLEDAARHPEGVIAVIAYFDPMADDAIGRLEAAVKFPGIIGFRLNSGNLPGSKRVLEEPRIESLLAAAERLGTVLQVFAPFQTREMHDIARRFPGLRILVDHMGLRFSEDGNNKEIFREWPALMRLAKEPNVWIKVSYFPEASSAFDTYPFPTGQRYFKELYETVGASKLIWGANFPPVLRVCSYQESLDFVREHCGFLSTPDRNAILGDTFFREFVQKSQSGSPP
jgi:predicted TIM-barrel fold metal-dependent hydrolase